MRVRFPPETFEVAMLDNGQAQLLVKMALVAIVVGFLAWLDYRRERRL